jgi:hypothetical protein
MSFFFISTHASLNTDLPLLNYFALFFLYHIYSTGHYFQPLQHDYICSYRE